MCIGQSKQKQTQKTGQIHTGTQQTVVPVMQSKRGWMDRVQNVFSGFGFAHNQEIPEEIQNETIQDDAVLLSGKKIGSMDMIKARREYRKKKEVARVRRSVVDEYYEKINTEEASLDKTASFRQKDSWDMMHILETDKQQGFMNGCHSQKPAEQVAALQMVYDKILKADFSIFAYRNDDDIYNHYEEKMRLMDAGHVLRKSLKEFVDNGGAMDEATLQELHARIDFLEQQRQMYISKDQTLLHPQYLMLRDNDLKELERLPAEELVQKSQNVDQTITALRTGIELLNTQAQETTSKKKKAEIQKKIDRAQRRIERLENLKSFIALYGAEMVRSRDEEGFQSLKPGEDPMAHLDTLRKQRKEHSRKQWTKNLEEFYAADLEMQQFQKLIIPGDFESGISEMATVHQAGLQGRVP
ncbi:MAG: hypothetical protein IJT34_08315, partial [Butyrivibrio sp.]|nr:hypothetical protein [Butyrivibrio sp.]